MDTNDSRILEVIRGKHIRGFSEGTNMIYLSKKFTKYLGKEVIILVLKDKDPEPGLDIENNILVKELETEIYSEEY